MALLLRLDLLKRLHRLWVQELDGPVLVEPGLTSVDETVENDGGVVVV